MGFVSLGACSFTIIDFCGPRGPLKINERLALCALDGDQVSDHFGYFPPAGAGTFGKDVVRFLLQNNPAGEPSSTITLMVIIHQGQWRPGHLGQLPPILGASALIHGAQSYDLNSLSCPCNVKPEKSSGLSMAFVWFFYGFLMVLINVEMAKWLFDGVNGLENG